MLAIISGVSLIEFIVHMLHLEIGGLRVYCLLSNARLGKPCTCVSIEHECREKKKKCWRFDVIGALMDFSDAHSNVMQFCYQIGVDVLISIVALRCHHF